MKKEPKKLILDIDTLNNSELYCPHFNFFRNKLTARPVKWAPPPVPLGLAGGIIIPEPLPEIGYYTLPLSKR